MLKHSIFGLCEGFVWWFCWLHGNISRMLGISEECCQLSNLNINKSLLCADYIVHEFCLNFDEFWKLGSGMAIYRTVKNEIINICTVSVEFLFYINFHLNVTNKTIRPHTVAHWAMPLTRKNLFRLWEKYHLFPRTWPAICTTRQYTTHPNIPNWRQRTSATWGWIYSSSLNLASTRQALGVASSGGPPRAQGPLS